MRKTMIEQNTAISPVNDFFFLLRVNFILRAKHLKALHELNSLSDQLWNLSFNSCVCVWVQWWWWCHSLNESVDHLTRRQREQTVQSIVLHPLLSSSFSFSSLYLICQQLTVVWTNDHDASSNTNAITLSYLLNVLFILPSLFACDAFSYLRCLYYVNWSC